MRSSSLQTSWKNKRLTLDAALKTCYTTNPMIKDQTSQLDWNATEALFESKTIAQIEAYLRGALDYLPYLRNMDIELDTNKEGLMTDEMSVARKILNIKKTSKARKIEAKLTPAEWDAIQMMRQTI